MEYASAGKKEWNFENLPTSKGRSREGERGKFPRPLILVEPTTKSSWKVHLFSSLNTVNPHYSKWEKNSIPKSEKLRAQTGFFCSLHSWPGCRAWRRDRASPRIIGAENNDRSPDSGAWTAHGLTACRQDRQPTAFDNHMHPIHALLYDAKAIQPQINEKQRQRPGKASQGAL